MKKIIAFVVAVIFSVAIVAFTLTAMGFIGFFSTSAVIDLSLNFGISKDIIWGIAGGAAIVLGIVIFMIWKKDEKF